MSKKPPFCCATFPKGAWWLLALLGAPLLFLLMIVSKQGLVEQDLQQRTTQELTNKNINWTTVKLDEQGRDAVLSGNAPDKATHDQALSLAQTVYGVRHVSNKMTIDGVESNTESTLANGTENNNIDKNTEATEIATTKTEEKPLKPAVFSLKEHNNKVVLTGMMPSQEAIDSLVETTKKSYRGKPVINKLTLEDDIAEAQWLSAVKTLIPALVKTHLKKVDLSVSEDKKSLSGITSSEADKASVLSSMTTAFGEKQAYAENITIETPKIETTTVATNSESESEAKEPESSSEPEETITKTEEPEVSPEPEETVAKTETPEASAEPEENPAIDACQNKINTVMQGKKILFENNKADIRSASFPLLNDIASILKECKDAISNKGISINGHTDSRGRDSYNQALSERRAKAVKNHLTKKGVSSTLMLAIGHGETQPIANNKTNSGRAQNRRITFKIKN